MIMAVKKRKKITIPEANLIPVTTLQYMFSKAQTVFRDWAAAGHIIKEGRGAYDGKSVLEYALKKDVSGNMGNANTLDDDEGMLAKALYEKAKADLAEIEIAIERQELVPGTEIDGYIVNILAIFKRELLALSRVMPTYLYGLEEDEIVEKLQSHLQKVYDDVIDRTDITSFKLYLED